MSSIAELLKEFSQESSQEEIREENIEEGQVGAEEMTVVTDETTTELEEAIEEVADAVEGQEQVADTTETLLDAAESLENAVAMIQNARLQGQRVNGIAMQIWARGVADSMEARQIPAEVYGDLLETFGDSFESDSYTDYSVEAEEKSEGIFAKIWNMIKAAFARARDFIARLIGWFGKSADAIIKAGRKLKEAAKDKKELRDPKAKVNGTPYTDLVSGGSTVKAASVVSIGEKIFITSDEAATEGYNQAVEMANQLKAGKAPEPNEELGNKWKKLHEFEFGGKKVVTSAKEGSSWYNDGKFYSKIKVEKGSNTAAKEQTPMDLSEINSLADNLVSLGETVKKRSDDAKRTQGKLNIDFPKKDDGKHAIEKMTDRRKAARAISSTVAASSSMRGTIASMVLATGKKAYVYGMANVRLYK